MTEHVELVYLVPSESTQFVSVCQTTAAQYLVYTTSSSLVPNSFDQVLKDHVVPSGSQITPTSHLFGTAAEE